MHEHALCPDTFFSPALGVGPAGCSLFPDVTHLYIPVASPTHKLNTIMAGPGRKVPLLLLLLLLSYTCSAHALTAETAGRMHATGKQPWTQPEKAQDTDDNKQHVLHVGVG